tara:strand:+ start:297 stop:1370 length:1074 start_codon:yes stop_codon:yes gene_type:complete
MRIPKSIIEENLHTKNFAPLYTGAGERYQGPVFRLITGELFTGPTVESTNAKLYYKDGGLLTTSAKAPKDDFPHGKTQYLFTKRNNEEYFASKKSTNTGGFIKDFIDNEVFIPHENSSTPTSYDYLKGNMIRFIAKSNYNNIYYFTTLDSYKTFKSELQSNNRKYLSLFNIKNTIWYIRANSREDVIKINEYYTNELKKNISFRDINRYINDTNYDEFYRDKNEQLYTAGNELIYDNGSSYRGLYHIHPDKGPMEGPIHTSNSHRQLFIKNRKGSLEAGIENLANVKALNKILKFLTINNIDGKSGSGPSTQQLIDSYRSEEQLLNVPVAPAQQITPSAPPPAGGGGGSYSGGGGGY